MTRANFLKALAFAPFAARALAREAAARMGWGADEDWTFGEPIMFTPRDEKFFEEMAKRQVELFRLLDEAHIDLRFR